jgi:predicted dienelactone hydrolase
MELKMIRCACVLAVCLLISARSHASEQSLTVAGLHVTLWSSQPDSVAQPVLIFSHGFHGCATQSSFLMEAFAAAGYLVLAPNHRDAVCNGGAARETEPPALPFREFGRWTDATYRDRADDIRAIVDALRTDERLRTRADVSRLGLVGHSLGGYTVLGMGGAWSTWKLDGVRAVLALSPYSMPFVAARTLRDLSSPVMYQGGTLDIGLTPVLRRPGGAYAQSSSPKYLVEFRGAGHLAWTDVDNVDRDAIAGYAVAFLNRYVKGSGPADRLLMRRGRAIATLRFQLETGDADHSNRINPGGAPVRTK